MKEYHLHKFIGPVVGLALFCVALAVLRREIGEFSYHDIVEQFRAIPLEQIVLAVFLTAGSYGMLTLYDFYAVKYSGGDLPYWKAALASFIGYTLSHNLGFALVTGGAVRYRLFSLWGLNTAQIARAIAFGGLMFWLGFCVLGGAVLVVEPPLHLEFPFLTPLFLRGLGLAMLAGTAGLLLFWGARHHALRLKEWEFPPPAPPLLMKCLAVAIADWTLAALAIYALLPPGRISIVQFLGVFLMSQMLGVASNIPGGLGVFEASILYCVGDTVPTHQLLGILAAYRLIYYLVPLAISTIALVIHEVVEQKDLVVIVTEKVKRRVSLIMPAVLTMATFIAGFVLLLSGATPAADYRMGLLLEIFPLPVVEFSHVLGSVAGAFLLLLARGLQRKLDAAYILASWALVVGIIASLLKGWDYEEAITLGFVLLLFLPSRAQFYRRARLFAEPFSIDWIAAIAAVLIVAAWLMLFSHRDVAYSHDLWWHFSAAGHAPRALRAAAGVLTVMFLWGLARLLSPIQVHPVPASPAELDEATHVLKSASRTLPFLAYLGDKALLFNEAKSAFIMYGAEGKSWIALGDPVGPEGELDELVWRFREECDYNSKLCAFYQVHPSCLPFYLDVGLTLVKLGEEALVPLDEFSLEGKSRSSLRHTKNKVEKEGCTFRVLPLTETPLLLPRLAAISDAWLGEKKTREKGFSLGFFQPDYIRRFPIAVVEKDGEIIAFANVWATEDKSELSVDLMRYLPNAASGMMEYLFMQMMLWGKVQGYRHFNLGMAPLSGLEPRELAPLWNKLGALIFQHGEHFYNFAGIRQYKEKFDPLWEPRYLASPGGLQLPVVIANAASLIAGGIRGIFAK